MTRWIYRKPSKKVLDPNLFEGFKLKDSVRQRIIEEANSYLPELNLESDDILGIYLIGSSAGYQWYPSADVDIQVVVDKKIKPKLFKSEEGLEGRYLGQVVVKPMTFFFTPELSVEYDAIFDVIKNQFVREPTPLYVKPDEALIYIKKWFSSISDALGELALDVYDYHELYQNYRLALEYGSMDDIISLEQDLKKTQAEVEKDLLTLELHRDMLYALRHAFKGDKWRNVGNVIFKSVEYASYKSTLSALHEVYSEYKKGEIDFETLIEKLKEILQI